MVNVWGNVYLGSDTDIYKFSKILSLSTEYAIPPPAALKGVHTRRKIPTVGSRASVLEIYVIQNCPFCNVEIEGA